MSGNLRRRLDKLVKEEAAEMPCPECGAVNGKWPDEAWRDEEIEVVWNDLEDVSEEEPEEFCSTCGAQLSFTILWDDTPQAKRRWGRGPKLMARCAAIKPNGERCKIEAIPDEEWCWSHHPDYEEQRRRRASKGGKRGGRGRPQAELANIKDRLQELVEDVLEEKVDKGAAAVAGQLLNTYLRAVSVELKAREQLELTERLEELEALVAARKERAWGA